MENTRKEARKQYLKEYFQKNKERLVEARRQYQKEYFQTNKEALAERSRQYYKENKEVIDEKHKEYIHRQNDELITPAEYLSSRSRVIEDADFLKHWNYYATSNRKGKNYTCSCGAILKPVSTNENERPTKTYYSSLVPRLNQHLKSKKHSICIERIEDFVDYLGNTFKKPVNKVWETYISKEFGDLD